MILQLLTWLGGLNSFGIFFWFSVKNVSLSLHIKTKLNAYSTKYSQAVTHPSTNLAQCCLTAVIRRELVCSTWYGRRHEEGTNIYYLFYKDLKWLQSKFLITNYKTKVYAYSTKYSQAVTHPSTNLAQCCLTSVIRRELVCSTWYGRRHEKMTNGSYQFYK